jgi:hypothetical protein
VGQVFNLRPILIGLGGCVPMPTRRVTNPPQVENLPHKFCRDPPAGDKNPSTPTSQLL